VHANVISAVPNKSRRVFEWLSAAADRWLEAESYRLAASLSFYTLSSLFPLMLVVFGVGAAVLGDASHVRAEFFSLLDATHSDATRELLESTLAGRASVNHERGQWSAIVGIAGALFGASGLFLELDAAFSKLFRIATPKASIAKAVQRLLRDRASALLLVAGTSVLLLVNTVVLAAAEVIVAHLPRWAALVPQTFTLLVSFVLTFVPLMFCYR